MKTVRKITAAALSVLLLGALTAPVFAETAPSQKEEVIYIMTDASGKVTDMEAVNIFSGGDIIDYGDYSHVKMLNTTDKITQSGDKITFSSGADKVYYQGTLKSTVIPWNISIRYFLDGKEYSAADMAGKSGALEIRFSVSKNGSCRGSFYDDYALQASFTLDTALCKNIVSSGATVANVGSDKQLTYTILPGKGIDTVIRADVTDFTMDAVAINGVRLHMNFEVDDAELMDKVDEIISAIGSIDDGAAEVRDGTGKLYDAAGTLNSKVGDLNSGVGELTDGAGDLFSGLSEITGKNDRLTDAAAGTKSLKLNMDSLYSHTGTLGLSVGELNDAVGKLYGGTKELAGGTAEFVDKTADMDTQISEEIDAMTASVTGGDGKTVSFVSDKNTQVDSVQFVIKTAAIEKAEAAASDAVEEAPLTFWQKLLRLFGLY